MRCKITACSEKNYVIPAEKKKDRRKTHARKGFCVGPLCKVGDNKLKGKSNFEQILIDLMI